MYIIKMKAFIWQTENLGASFSEEEIPDHLLDQVKSCREKMFDIITLEDENLLSKYLSEEEISEEEIKNAIRKGTISNSFVPVLFGSAFKNKGVQLLLGAVIDYLPSPMDLKSINAIKADKSGDKTQISVSEKESFSALAFKVMSDPFLGSLTFVRIYSGSISSGMTVTNTTKNKNERIGRMMLMHANQREEIKEAKAGEIVAFAGLKHTTTGNTLSAGNNLVILEQIDFPKPVIELAVEPVSALDQEKMSIALNKLCSEDPSLEVTTDKESAQVIIKGMGELHLEIIVDRMLREFKVKANVGAPQVAYRETINSQSSVDYTHKKQTKRWSWSVCKSKDDFRTHSG